MQRIVSLIPSATEIVCALGCEDRVVGRSHECDYPASIVNRPVCTEPKFPVDGSSREIDQHVKGLLKDALSVYRVHPDTLQRLQPDLIVTQTQCDVCAVSLRDVENAVAEWVGSKPAIVSLQTTDLSGVWQDISRVAESTGQVKQGIELLQSVRHVWRFFQYAGIEDSVLLAHTSLECRCVRLRCPGAGMGVCCHRDP